MNGARRTVAAGEFKARCLALLDRVARTKETYIITKRGRPVAQVTPIADTEPAPLRRSITYHADIVGPLDESWAAEE